MVRVSAKRERPCIALLHVALRAAAIPAAETQRRLVHRQHAVGVSASSFLTTSPERFVWKSRRTAEVYASAVLSHVRAWWEMLGGVRYGLPDAVRLASAIWDGENSSNGVGGAVPTASLKSVSKRGIAAQETERKTGKSVLRDSKRERRVSDTKKRSGVLRCAVELSRSLYGDASALHIFRAACACVTEVHVSVPMSTLSSKAAEEHGAEMDLDERKGSAKQRRRRDRSEDGGPRMEQGCHAAVRVARVEHAVSSRKH